MKALMANGEWKPKEGYPVTEEENRLKRAAVGSQVWRNTRFDIVNVPVPELLDDEVLIRVKTCGICGSDTHVYETDKDGYILFSGLTRFPCVIGHEFSGIVEQAGSRVTGLKTGDIVAVESVMWCGMCTPCRSGSPNQCRNVELMGLSRNGALAEYIAINQRYCWKLNDLRGLYGGDEIFDIGALVEPVGCAYNGLFVVGGGFNPGSTIVVYGTGPIGLGAVALAKAAGADIVISFDIQDGRVGLARAVGADYAYNSKTLDGARPSDIIMEITKGFGAEIQIEAAGAAPYTIPEMEKSLSNQGKIIYLGRAATSTPMYLDTLVSGANRVVGARGHAGYGIFPNIIRLLSRGRLNIAPMVSRKFQFKDAVAALKASSDRNLGKILVSI
ncbi:MAG: alcohol dehydrogenase catalytic domain-containing protein [Deltaproteobacteria bacterium]|nr:alcohol dehydrogenase catalytic domain-containing protein [Deltaproteobacteria bacterium]